MKRILKNRSHVFKKEVSIESQKRYQYLEKVVQFWMKKNNHNKPLTFEEMKKMKIELKYVTSTVGTRRLRIWSSKAGAKEDLTRLRTRGYKVSLTPDDKTVIIHGKTLRGDEKDIFGKRIHRSKTLRHRRLGSTRSYEPTYPSLRQSRRFGPYWV